MSEELSAAVKQIVKEAVKELRAEGVILLSSTDETARKLAEINAQIYISIPEAEMLFRISDTTLYRHIKAAEQGADDPIPYIEVSGVKMIHRTSFIKWATPERLQKAA